MDTIPVSTSFYACERGNTMLANDDGMVAWIQLSEGIFLCVSDTPENNPRLEVTIRKTTPEEIREHVVSNLQGWQVIRWNLDDHPPVAAGKHDVIGPEEQKPETGWYCCPKSLRVFECEIFRGLRRFAPANVDLAKDVVGIRDLACKQDEPMMFILEKTIGTTEKDAIRRVRDDLMAKDALEQERVRSAIERRDKILALLMKGKE